MPKRNDAFQRNYRKFLAEGRQELRDQRTNEEQIQMVLARTGNHDCKELHRLASKSSNTDKRTYEERLSEAVANIRL